MVQTLEGWGRPLAGVAAAGGSALRQLRARGIGTVRLVGFGRVPLESAEDPEAPFPVRAEPTVRFLAGGIDAVDRADDRLDAAGARADSTAHLSVAIATAPDGARSMVVSIPGTDFASLGNLAEPNGLATVVDNFAVAPEVPLAQTSALMQMVDAALLAAGSDGSAPVLLAGFSQGGMAALALAGNREFLARHRLAGVLTLGAPSRHYSGTPEVLPILDVADREDPVAGLDARGPAGDAQAILLRTDVGAGILRAHSIRTYLRAAEEADERLGGERGGPEYIAMLKALLPRDAPLEVRVYGSSSQIRVGEEPVGEAHRHAPGEAHSEEE
ncbi:hypothetical protein [Rothia halotolerans]|uniref:hypothetical protein n=1 Tax=Rothia halotolerans TaxID=405770 RepID=UPI00101D220B|nr:hypothetical protein [Rothia halotolerans]